MKFRIFIIFIFFLDVIYGKLSQKSAVIDDVADHKDFKKLLRTKNNVLIMYLVKAREAQNTIKIFKEVANVIKGEGTLVLIDCGGTNVELKKMCKKLKIPLESSSSPFYIKHYKDGSFYKDYDRQFIATSMVNFMRDPTGDLPWDEDPIGADVVHIKDMDNLKSILNKQIRPMMVMFYAPWCGYCKQMKPDFSAAATELKSKYIIAGMDVNRPENVGVRKIYNITGFPTLLYFESGKLKHTYEGENNKAAIIEFMENPTEPALIKINKDDWALDLETQIVHLTDSSFMPAIQDEKSVLVMFYAPWCGHCKRMKPEYEKAALSMRDNNIQGVLAAIDATKETAIASQFNVKGYPTVKFFVKGEFKFDVNVRDSDKIIEFMKNPSEPPPPPPPEKPWEDENSGVEHLNDENFSQFLKRKKHVLVMFYAPWCGHCKKAKPEFEITAEHFKDDFKTKLAAVDCTQHKTLCASYDVKGYPTIKYFSHYKIKKDYTGGRTAADFIKYLKDPDAVEEKPAPEPFGTYPGSDNVILLTDENFDEKLKTMKKAVVMFYAPWCGHCTQMKPAYSELAQRLAQNNIDGFAVAVDATQHHKIAGKFSIKGFPTIKYFENGSFVKDFNGERTANSLYNFMENNGIVKDEL